MKGLKLRNSSRLVNSILLESNHRSFNESAVDLEFSTFKSEDYRVHEQFMFPTDRSYEHNQSLIVDLTREEIMSDKSSESGEEYVISEVGLLPLNQRVKKLSFHNRKTLISQILFPDSKPKRKGLTLKNKSSIIGRILPLGKVVS